MSERTRVDPEARFWSHVATGGPDDCWEWTGSRNRKGYGFASYRGKVWRSNRLAWALTYGPMPDGLIVCHSCDNPPCVNPAHLWLGTHSANHRDKVVKGRGNTQKIAADQAREIKRLIALGLSTPEIVGRTSVRREFVYSIRAGRAWAHLDSSNEEMTE